MADRAYRSKSPVDPTELKGRRLGRVLTKLKKVTREQVQEALQLQKTRKEPLGQLLVGLGYITDTDVLEALAGQAGMRMVELKVDAIPNSAIEALPAETANTYQIIPLKFDSGTRHIVVAMKSPDNFRAVDDLRLLMGFKVEAVVAPCDQIDSVLKKRYGEQAPSMAAVMAEL
ncbi:MAG: pilus assembly protein PilB, partial [Planctomycetes bacterium]|nr:pilus assembly protein PilB [Planctomycetota bacterium]